MRFCEHATHCQDLQGFEPLMTIMITEDTTVEMVRAARKAGVVAGKTYPRNVTTNSEHGVLNYVRLYPVYKEMAEHGMVASFHDETPHEPETMEGMEREFGFIPVIEPIAEKIFGLQIVVEHVADRRIIEWVSKAPVNVAATITPHHMVLLHDDVIGYNLMREGGHFMHPHEHCKPTAKTRADRKAIITAAISGNAKFFLGSDGAPHDITKGKHCVNVCAGVFSDPVALPLLADIFEQNGRLESLEGFTSLFGSKFYGLLPSRWNIKLVKEPWEVPEMYENVRPFKAGETLPWQVRRTP